MSDSTIRELERRWQETGDSGELIAWITQRVRSADPSLNEEELLAHARRLPELGALRRLLAEWLPDVDPAPCAAFLDAEASLLAAPDDAATRERFHLARGVTPAAFLARIEQPSLMRGCPLPLPTGWVSVGLGDYRPVGATYGSSQFEDAPDLPPERVLDFAWLHEVEIPPAIGEPGVWRQQIDILETRIVAMGYLAPTGLMTLLREHLPRTEVIDSCTDCYFCPGQFKPVEALGGLVVPFYNDSQSCVTWGLWLHAGGAQAVVSFTLIWDVEEDPDLPGDLTEPVDEQGTRLGGFAFVSPSLEAFVYRTWIENELWFGLNPGDWVARERDLSQPELARYLAHYRRDDG